MQRTVFLKTNDLHAPLAPLDPNFQIADLAPLRHPIGSLIEKRRHLLGNLQSRCDPEIVISLRFAGDLVEGPGAARAAIDMTVDGDVDHDRLILAAQAVRDDIVVALDEFTRRSSEAHGM